MSQAAHAYEGDFDQETGEVHGAQIVREGVGSREIQLVTETASTALAARETADVQARHAMARRFPRVFDDVHTALMKACVRPAFAERATYRRPQGYKKDENGDFVKDEKGKKVPNLIEGPSIRFVEECIRAMTNFEISIETKYDDERKRILKVRALDLETNNSWPVEVHVEKTTERRFLGKGQVPMATRRNAYGDVLYIFPATDDEVTVKQNALTSKAARTAALRLIPSDLVDDGQAACERVRTTTLREGVMRDPTAARKELVAKFDSLGVKAADLIDYMGGRPLDSLTVDEVIELRIIGAAIKDKEGQWREFLATSPYREQSGDEPTAEKTPAAKKAEELRKSVEQKKNAAKAKRDAKGKPQADAKSTAAAPSSAAGGEAGNSEAGPPEKPQPTTPPAEPPPAAAKAPPEPISSKVEHLPGCRLLADHGGPCEAGRQSGED